MSSTRIIVIGGALLAMGCIYCICIKRKERKEEEEEQKRNDEEFDERQLEGMPAVHKPSDTPRRIATSSVSLAEDRKREAAAITGQPGYDKRYLPGMMEV